MGCLVREWVENLAAESMVPNLWVLTQFLVGCVTLHKLCQASRLLSFHIIFKNAKSPPMECVFINICVYSLKNTFSENKTRLG